MAPLRHWFLWFCLWGPSIGAGRPPPLRSPTPEVHPTDRRPPTLPSYQRLRRIARRSGPINHAPRLARRADPSSESSPPRPPWPGRSQTTRGRYPTVSRSGRPSSCPGTGVLNFRKPYVVSEGSGFTITYLLSSHLGSVTLTPEVVNMGKTSGWESLWSGKIGNFSKRGILFKPWDSLV